MRARETILSRSPKRRRARRARRSSQSPSSSPSTTLISATRAGSCCWERRCRSSARRSLTRSISSWMSFTVVMLFRTRPARGLFLAVAQLVDALLVEAEVVRELVQDGDPDLALQLLRVGERLLEWQPVDRDLGRQVLLLLEQAEQVRIVGMLVLD